MRMSTAFYILPAAGGTNGALHYRIHKSIFIAFIYSNFIF